MTVLLYRSYPALDSSLEIINNNVTRRCEPLPAPLGAAVGVAIAGVIVVVLVVGSGLLLCMCCR